MYKSMVWICTMLLLLLFDDVAFSIDCPKQPEQINKDWEVEVNATIAKIGPVKGGELKSKTRNATQDLLGKLPDSGKIYLEQMMFSAYCSAIRDDKSIKESEKARLLKEYISEVRKTINKSSSSTSKPKSKSPKPKVEGLALPTKDHVRPNPPTPESTPSATAERGSAMSSSSQVPQLQQRGGAIQIKGSSDVTMVGNYIEGYEKAIEVDNSSRITARGNVINRKAPNGSFPLPTGELSGLTNTALQDITKKIVSEMRAYEASHDQREREMLLTDRDFSRRAEEMEKLRTEKMAGFNAIYSAKSISLTSEMLRRIGRVEISPTDSRSIPRGAFVVQRGVLVGPHPMGDAADFLDHLAKKLPQ